MCPPTELDSNQEAQEAQNIKDKLDSGDAAGLKETINRLYSEHGGKELNEVLAKLKADEAKAGVNVDITEHDGKLPDIVISGTDTKTDHKHDFKFDSSKDSGGDASVKKDAGSHVTDFKTPDGKEYKIEYDSDGKPSKVTIPDAAGPTTFEKTSQGWEIKGIGVTDISSITVDDTGALTIVSDSSGKSTSHPDGSYEKYDTSGHLVEKIDDKGTKTDNTYNALGELTGSKVKAHNSNLTEIRDGEGNRTGYEFKDKDGHKETLYKNLHGGETLTRGEKTYELPAGTVSKIEPNGDRSFKLPAPDGRTLEGKADGTWIEKDKNGHITEFTGPEGNTTKYTRDARGNATAVEVKDGLGNVIESAKKGAKGWETSARDGDGNPIKVADVKVNDKDGTWTSTLADGGKIEHKVDGAEEHFDKKGKHIDSRADEYVKKMKDAHLPLSEKEEARMRADLAMLEKMPKETRERVFASLDKVATANTDATTKLTPEERAQIATSMAHTLAHPEDVQQGGKNACTMANVELLMAKNHPDLYADMVSKLATTGEYKASNGKKVTIQKEADGSLAPSSDGYGVRPMASEIFQDAVANLGVKDGEKYVSHGPNDLTPRPPGVEASTDSGERVEGWPDGKREKLKDGTEVIHENMGDLDGDGKDDYRDWLVLSEGKAVRGFTGMGIDAKEQMLDALMPGDGYTRKPIKSTADLESAIASNGGPPLNVGVSLDNRVDVTGMAEGSAGTEAGNHAVTITRIETLADGTKVVYFENSATSGDDHSYPNGKGVPIDDFVKAMKKTNREALVTTKCGIYKPDDH